MGFSCRYRRAALHVYGYKKVRIGSEPLQIEQKSHWMAQKSCHGQTLMNECLFRTTLPTLKACNSTYMQYYFKRCFQIVLHSSEVIFSFLIKKSRQKAIEIETALFHSLGNPNGRTLDHFFYASHIRHNFPYKLIPISMS